MEVMFMEKPEKPITKEEFQKYAEKYSGISTKRYLGYCCEWCCAPGRSSCPCCDWRYTKLVMIWKKLAGEKVPLYEKKHVRSL